MSFVTLKPQSEFSVLLFGSIPLLLYAMSAAAVVFDAGKSLLELKPPELQFVLAGPFSNSHILSYRLLTLLIAWIPISLFFAVFLLPQSGTFLGGFLTILLSGSAIALISFQYTLLKPRLSSPVLLTIRLAALTSLAMIAVESVWRLINSDQRQSFAELDLVINQGWAARIAGLPFRSFAVMFGEPFGTSLVLSSSLSLAFVALVALGCYRTNAGFAELAVEGVARRRERMERIKGGNSYGIAVKRKTRKRIFPTFGWLGGVGPIAWSQVASSLRRTGNLVPGLILIGLAGSMVAMVLLQIDPDLFNETFRDHAVPIALAGACYLGLLTTMTLPSGFATNRRLLTLFQTIPIRPISMAIGMTAGTVTLMVTIQLAFFLPAVVITTQSWLHCGAMLYAGIVAAIAYASTTNFVSATTGLRPMPENTPDVFQGMRMLMFMLVFAIALIPNLVVGAVGGLMGVTILGFSWTAAATGAGSAVLSIQPIYWWIAGERFVNSEPQDD